MANIDILIPHILKWEGESKFTNDPLDRGGATKYGITLNTLQSNHYDINHDGKINTEDVKSLQLRTSNASLNLITGTDGRRI